MSTSFPGDARHGQPAHRRDMTEPGNVHEHSALTPHPVICVSNGFQTNYERGFCNALAAHGVRVTLLSSDATDTAGLAPLVRAVNVRGSQDAGRPRWQKVLNLGWYHLRVLAHTVTARAAIVHTMGSLDPPLLGGVIEGLWFRAWARRYVLTVHDLLPHDRHTAFNRFVHHWSFRIPHALVVHTDRMKRDLVDRFGVAADRVVVMQHGIEPGDVPSDRRDDRLGPNATPTLLMLGRIAPYKGVDLLLDALRETKFECRLLIAGSCWNQGYRKQLRDAIDVHPRRAQIEWRDTWLQEDEIETLLQAADLLVLPYRHIDQSGVLFQALRFGVPMVVSRVGSLDEFVGPAVGEVAEPGDAAELVAALQRWFDRRETFSRSAIRAIGKSFDWPKTVASLRLAYAGQQTPTRTGSTK